MKKFWIYMAMPVALLNGCRHQQGLLEDARNLTVESESGGDAGEAPEQGEPEEDGETAKDGEPENVGKAAKDGEPEEDGEAAKDGEPENVGKAPEHGESEERADKTGDSRQKETAGEPGDSAAFQGSEGKPASVILRENTVREAAFDGSTVSIVRSEKEKASQITEAEIEAMVREAAADLNTVVKNGQTVVLKPNLVQMIVDSTGEKLDREVNGVTADWRVTRAVLKMVRELNPDGKVYIMEGSATGPTREVMEYFRYTERYMEGVDGFICLEEDCGAWQDFDADEVVKVDLPEGLLHKSYYFNRILYEADVIISIPALKTSSGVVVTAGIKNVSIGTPPGNLYGMGPDTPSKQKMVSHKIVDGELDKWIYDYYKAKPVDYVVVDGLQGFQSGPVPMSGERKNTDQMNMRLVLAGKDAVAVDTVCCLIMGWDPESVGYLNLFRNKDGAGDTADIRVRGSQAHEVRKPFTIYRENLGGSPVKTEEGPKLRADVTVDGDSMSIAYETGKETVKLEVYIDGLFQASRTVEEEGEKGSIRLTVPGLSLGEHEITVAAYDRFLNRTAVELADH